MTIEGSIITDGILASCFSQIESHFAQKIVYDILVLIRRGFGFLMTALNDPIQHIPSFINSVHYISHSFVPFVKY